MTVTEQSPLSKTDLERIDAYWRAANYLSVGQIYLLDNPLLTEPLRPEHIKPRLLGHWGTTPGLNLIYAHANRVIRNWDLSMIYVTGPGHGGPGIVANTYLEGTYSELYPNISQDAAGMQRLFRQFSFPGGIQMNLQLHTVITDFTGQTGLNIVRGILAGVYDPEQLAAHRDPRCKAAKADMAAALTGNYRAEHCSHCGRTLRPMNSTSGRSLSATPPSRRCSTTSRPAAAPRHRAAAGAASTKPKATRPTSTSAPRYIGSPAAPTSAKSTPSGRMPRCNWSPRSAPT